MSDLSNLDITIKELNWRLAEHTNAKVRRTRSYGEVRLAIDYEDGGTKLLPCHKPKACLLYADGMVEALRLIER